MKEIPDDVADKAKIMIVSLPANPVGSVGSPELYQEIVMTTPAGPDGKVNPSILAAAVIAGIDKIFKTGGAQAVEPSWNC